ncbi:hypothetical protein PAXRUDRAFT_822504 [Paxillus rubicundulus Ve08.2h10]|uniref:Uncharacterized protein n=1 Tax=Paxillus rubicundulus Ve08.2h10 TaxID=930991 RepID=A0A0D0ECN0_9AGAM|nr:hypothetical protein PAXRUDRAFT_822504 [Paxillus rubicundulus Ve08.2h10]
MRWSGGQPATLIETLNRLILALSGEEPARGCAEVRLGQEVRKLKCESWRNSENERMYHMCSFGANPFGSFTKLVDVLLDKSATACSRSEGPSLHRLVT